MREDEPHSTEGEEGFVGEGRDRNLFSLLNGLGQEPVFLLAAAALLLTLDWMVPNYLAPCHHHYNERIFRGRQSMRVHCPSLFISCVFAKWEYDKKTRQVVLHSSAVVMLCCSNEITKQKLSNYKKAALPPMPPQQSIEDKNPTAIDQDDSHQDQEQDQDDDSLLIDI